MSNILYTELNILDIEDVMSYKEKSTWASLLLTGFIFYFYINELLVAQQLAQLSEEFVVSLFVKIVLITIVIEIVSQTSLALMHYKEAEKGDDEREKQFKLLGYRNAYHVITAGIFIALFLLWSTDISITNIGFSELSPAYNTLSYLLISFLLAEITYYASQAFLYRRGF